MGITNVNSKLITEERCVYEIQHTPNHTIPCYTVSKRLRVVDIRYKMTIKLNLLEIVFEFLEQYSEP